MSFILDALRKSESQRRLETVPEVMRVPIAVNREPRLPAWAVTVMAVLTLALLVLIAVSWRGTLPRTAAPARLEPPNAPVAAAPVGTDAAVEGSSAPAPPPTTAQAGGTAVSSEPTRADPAPATTSLPAADIPARAPAIGTAPAQAPGAQRPTTPAPPAQSPTTQTAAPAPPVRAPIDASRLPSATALRAAGAAIPVLDLQLLVTSATPANRLVVINGRRYREGERLSEGPELVEIVSQGAVLRHAGQEFLLVTD